MRKLLIRLITIVFTTVVVYTIAVSTASTLGGVQWLPNVKYLRGDYGYTLLRLEEAKKIENVDILFIGSSHVYRAFDPNIFKQHKIKTFNLGTSAQPPFVSYYLLKKFLPNKRPEYVVMDLYWAMLSTTTSAEAGVDVLSNIEIDENMMDMVWNSKDVMLFNSALIRSFYQAFPSMDNVRQHQFEDERYVQGGFVESLRKRNSMSSEQLLSIKKRQFVPAELQLEYLRKIIALCKVHDVKLIFVITPSTKEYVNAVTNYDEYTALVEKLASENNLRFIDFNQKKDLYLESSYDFSDESHLSQSGVEKFNKFFIEELERIGVVMRTSSVPNSAE